MGKTLAEKIRGIELDDLTCVIDEIGSSVFGEEVRCRDTGSCNECHAVLYAKLANAVEAEQAELRGLLRDYRQRECDGISSSKARGLPEGVEWPRFEDGELVRFGDIARVRDDIGEVIEIRFHTGKCSEVTIAFEDESTATHYMVIDGERVKRPEPEVLDADGAPIRVGDTVWHEVDGSELTVVGFRDEKEDGEVMIDVEGKWLCVRQFSVTHRKPDTQEAIDADAVKDPCVYFNGTYIDKCSDCPIGSDADTCWGACQKAQRLDLLKRQRELWNGGR